mmetsp:Transcript_94688/g.276898  ORF Transcript_94688/g.276898 Transcript_94688/m.276898 type:complete len:412 (-) Transcript_94688:7-1242(-)
MAAWLARLSRAFELDPLIDEYALVPEASPSLFGGSGDQDQGCLVQEHKLALSVEAALVIYRQALAQLTAPGAPQAASSAAAARAGLLCSADCAEAWRRREALLATGALEPEGELQLGALLLRTNHKSGETWAYRRHVLALALSTAAPEHAAEIASRELALVEELARKYDHHYYAWNHWAWLERFCKEALPRAGEDATAASLVGAAFPRLARVTPSHYGLFHHRVVRLRGQLLCGGLEEASPPASSGPLQLPSPALDAFAAERELSSSLLSTFPHLEAPWLFRLQLFAALLDASEALDSSKAPGAEAVRAMLELWRSDLSFATEQEEGASDGGNSAVGRLARRFRAHALQELAAHLQPWRRRGSSEAAGLCSAVAGECLAALEALEAEQAAAPVVLRGIRLDLEDVRVEVAA